MPEDFDQNSLPVKSLKLNDEYTAIINKDNITVGCQTISHDVIRELYKIISK
jgi:hypothetical protein